MKSPPIPAMCFFPAAVLLAVVLLSPQWSAAHGGVVEENDLCVIKISYLKAHFKIYQPRVDGHDEYCEDLPNATESVFVMEYLHDELGKLAIDFRIIRNVTGKGRFARWEDVAAIDDLDSATVFYQKPVVEADVFSVLHNFDEDGDYIGIVTVMPDAGKTLEVAVFPFEVGFTGLGYWPFFIAVVAIVQLQYFVMSGRVGRWRAERKRPNLAVMKNSNDAH